MGAIRNIYKVARSVLFTAIITVAALYLILYVLLSIPPVQNQIKGIAEAELTKFLGGDVSISNVNIRPFNEVSVDGLTVKTPDGETCLRVQRVGAGINLMRLLTKREIELTYGEIIGLDGKITQKVERGPLNIQFIIDAFAPKDPDKPKSKFDLKLRNVVLRRCRLRYDREWIPPLVDTDRVDFNHLVVNDLKADMAFPVLKNDDITIDLRRMAFELSGGLTLEKLAFKARITPASISVQNLVLAFPETEIQPSDIVLRFSDFKDIKRCITDSPHTLTLSGNKITPSDFKGIVPQLVDFNTPFFLSFTAAGDADKISVEKLTLTQDENLALALSASAYNLRNIEECRFTLQTLEMSATDALTRRILTLLPEKSSKVKEILSRLGSVSLVGSGEGDMASRNFSSDIMVSTSCGNLSVSAKATGLRKGSGKIKGEIGAEEVDLRNLIGKGKIGRINGNIAFEAGLRGKDADGEVNLYLSDIEIGGKVYDGLVVEASKDGNVLTADVTIDNDVTKAKVNTEVLLDGESSSLSLLCDVERFEPQILGLFPNKANIGISGNIRALLVGNNVDNVAGEIKAYDLEYSLGDKTLELKNLALSSSFADSVRSIRLRSDWIDGEIDGKFKAREILPLMKQILAKTLPSLFMADETDLSADTEVEFSFLLNADNAATEFFNLPVRLLVPVPIDGNVRGSDYTANLSVDIPYIQQGKNKLIRDSRLNVSLNGDKKFVGLEVATTMPAKKGDLALDVRVWGEENDIYADLGWKNPDNDSFKGLLSLGAVISRDELTSKPEVNVDINPSVFDIGPSRWNIDKGRIVYDNEELSIENLKLWHDNQFVAIDGVASALPEDSVSVRLADIDLDYIFDLLKINYVTFGGAATGDVTGRAVFSKNPEARTDNLFVEGLSYNGAVLGDGYLKSEWLNEEKKITIYADIKDKEERRALVDGGIWLGRDSLSFDVDADKIPVEFLKPFMSAFTSDVKGRASGQAKLFGTFKDIDLTGALFADSIAMKLDFTNTWYHGSDSVYLNPGHIVIPSFRLYDDKGNSAILTGDLTHRYFHEPRFTFRISDAHRLLCYDTNSKMNPDWYGTIYGNGGAVVKGWPGMVQISVDMDVVGSSSFTFVLNDTEAAEDYHFLTFSDKRKEERERLNKDSVPDILAAFRKQIETQNNAPSKFSLDIRASVNPSALVTLVMDPVSGDKITARGNGAIQVEYESDSEEMQMFGKYTLDEGNYNFSLQDLILRDFSIRPGSTISFNGDPLNANLDITAAYRVNTNLSDLDKSFSTDKDLARTNVPVDALLMVNGEMQHPDITFDIELPTLTQDVERKVKSIVSTDDMMSRQIIYLLALNRFYTPEYMGTSSNGGELAAVASTTLSSQLSNMLGQLTDKFTVAPSFRSDKGDFSDLEVDVALSSRLLNNRLLVNGNFGYRDKSTSSTTFVGDFDIEYLLSRNGNLRLKAYNHFNDQNYYLREALTTQGIGVVYRRDFDNLFKSFRKKKDSSEEEVGKMEVENGILEDKDGNKEED